MTEAPSRLIAVRMPEAIVKKRRRIAKKNAKKKGHTSSKPTCNWWCRGAMPYT